MNYLLEIKAFYDRLELNPLPSPAIALWHALMSIANKTGWQQEFTVAVSVLVLKSGLNAQAIKRARNKLEQDGYIKWRSRGGCSSAAYQMISIVVQSTTKNVPQSEPQNDHNVNHNLYHNMNPLINKTIQNIIPPISPVERFEDFLLLYPENQYGNPRNSTEHAYIDVLLTGSVTEEELIGAVKNYAESCDITGMLVRRSDNFFKDCFFETFLPGKYVKPKSPANKDLKKNNFNQFSQNQYDFDQLEKELLEN